MLKIAFALIALFIVITWNWVQWYLVFTSGWNWTVNERRQNFHHLLETIDYTREDGRFPVPASYGTTSNPNLLPSSEAGVIPAIRSWKTLIWKSLASESHWWYLLHKEVKSWDSTIWFRIWQNQTPGLKAVSSKFKCIYTGGTVSFLGGDDQGFLWEGVMTYLMAPLSPLANFSFRHHIYSLCFRPTGSSLPGRMIAHVPAVV